MISRRALLLATGIAALLLIGASWHFRRWLAVIGPATRGPDIEVTYGAGGFRHAGLWLPDGAGPHPIVVMIHGGCWRSGRHAAAMMSGLAGDLRRRGIAVWNIEYRGVGQPGGGWPGTFEDVLASADALRRIGPLYHLRTDRTVAVGHSAGGHLALWLASRRPLAGVVTLGAPTDLAAGGPDIARACGAGILPRLVGAPSPKRPDVFADTSPIRLPPSRIPITLISGGEDTLVPAHWAEAYARRRGGSTRSIVAGGDGHVDELLPDGPSWHAAADAITTTLR